MNRLQYTLAHNSLTGNPDNMYFYAGSRHIGIKITSYPRRFGAQIMWVSQLVQAKKYAIMIKQEFYRFLSNKLGILVTDATSFFGGVGLSGLDADEFIEMIAKEFKVDFGSFNYRDYYIDDGTNFLRLVFDFFYKTRKMPTQSFTARHLYDVTQKGVWFDMDLLENEV